MSTPIDPTASPSSLQTDALAELGVGEVAARIRHGEIGSEQLTRHLLDRAQRHRHLNAFITLDPDLALAAAREADAARAAGAVLGPLHGVPLVVKDNIQVAGMPCSAGTPALRNHIPPGNAPVAQALLDAGAVILGKTNMHELAFGIAGYNEGFWQQTPIGVRNPYDLTRIAGGSSSGTAAAIGARLAPGGLGSDTGASSRLPATLTGGAGYRPTVGRYSGAGIAPISHTRDTAGPMARTVADLALLDAVLAGETPVSAVPLTGVRLGVVREYFFAGLDADTQAVIDTALARLSAAGVQLVELTMPRLAGLNEATSMPVALYEAYDDLAAYLREHNTGLTVEQVAAQIASQDVRGTYEMLVLPRKLPGPDGLVDARPIYERAIAESRPALQAHYAETFASHAIDALAYPTCPAVACVQGPEAAAQPVFMGYIRNLDPSSNAGIPSLALSAGLGPTTGLPVGLSLDGPVGTDRRILALGMAIEQVLGRLPPPR
jgi:mandelamide amidase